MVFKIIAVGADPDGGSGSKLPNLVIEICDTTNLDIGNFTKYSGPRYQIVK